MNKKKLAFNIFAQLLTFASSLMIGLVITPHIVAHLGEGAYSYIGIANNFASYVTIVTSAIDAMAARFISIELHKGNRKRASIYFNSVFIADLVLSFFAMIFGAILTFNIENLLNVSPELLIDVKITFALVFLNLILNLATSVFGVAPFVTDNLEKSAIRGFFSNLIKLGLLVGLFSIFPPKIYFVTISIMGTSIFLMVTNFLLKQKLLPEIKLNIREFEIDAVKSLMSSGIWSSLSKLSSILLTEMQVIITNVAIGEKEAGLLSVARTVPVNIFSLISTLAIIFTPHFVILYAQGNIKALLKEAKYVMKILPFMLIVPLAGFICFGDSFFKLWMYSKTGEDLIMLQKLSILSMGTNIMCIFVYPLSNINTTTNKVKWPVIVTFITGVLNIITVAIVLKFTHIGVFAVNSISTAYSMLRLLLFVPMYAAHNLKLKLSVFYSTIFRGIMSFGIVVMVFSLLNLNLKYYIHNWVGLIVIAGVCGCIGYVIVYFTLFNKEEKKKVYQMIVRKMKKEQ